jgi:hypothetical protein
MVYIGLKFVYVHITLCFNFYQINEDGEIQTHNRLVIKALILCQKTILTQ